MAEPRPLDEQLAILGREAPGSDPAVQRITIALHRMSRAMSHAYRRALLETGVSLPDYQVLRALLFEGAPYTLNPKRIAEICGQTQSTITGRLDSLESRGLVRRESAPDSRVRVNVVLTAEGRDAWRHAYEYAAKAEEAALAALDTDDKQTLDALLSRLLAAQSGEPGVAAAAAARPGESGSEQA